MEKSVEKSIQAWFGQAREDLKTAHALLKSKRYTWCAFVCQQSLEKCLKAGYVKIHKKIPPYTHKLEYLCQLLDLRPPEHIVEVIIKVDKYYIAARYPTYKESINISRKDIAAEIYSETKEAFQWLCRMFAFKK